MIKKLWQTLEIRISIMTPTWLAWAVPPDPTGALQPPGSPLTPASPTSWNAVRRWLQTRRTGWSQDGLQKRSVKYICRKSLLILDLEGAFLKGNWTEKLLEFSKLYLLPAGNMRHLSLCVGCGGQIHDQYILRVAPNLEWHAACLKCSECQMYLDENCTCFVRDGKTFCKKDYMR